MTVLMKSPLPFALVAKWQTRKLEVLVGNSVEVRVLSSAFFIMPDVYKLPKIGFIACGGTIGGEWSAAHDTVIPTKKGNRNLFNYLEERVRLHRKIVTVDLFNKDSRAVNKTDRLKIGRSIQKLIKKGCRHFLITHGTYTLQESALFLEEFLENKGIKDIYVVFVASMIPHTAFASFRCTV